MPLGDIEKTSRFEVISDKLPPGLQVRKPAYSTIGSEDDIKFPSRWKNHRQVINIGADKIRIYTHLFAYGLCQAYALIRKVDTGYLCSQSCPGKSIQTK